MPRFSIAILSALLTSVLALNAGADSSRRDIHKNLKFDLSGDGRPDTIALKNSDQDSKFQLTINGKSVTGELEVEPTGFYIANINRADKFYEVVVYTPGGSDDDEHLIYWYDGKKIQRLAHLQRWVTYRGDGTLSVADWAGFWKPTDEWTLTRTHQLRQKPRTSYPVNIKATTTKTTPLHTSIGSKKTSLAPTNRAALIVKSNPKRTWYYIKVGNKAGWLSEAELYDHLTGMPVAD